MADSQIPLHFDMLGKDGRLNQPWAFWFQNFVANLPPSGSGFVIDGSAGTYGPMTIYQGADINKGTPGPGDIYFALDTGKIYVAVGGNWVLQDPEYTGDVLKAANSTVQTLAPVGIPGTYGSSSQVPVVTTDSKGRVTNITLVPVDTGAATAAGSDEQIQYNTGGSLDANAGLTFNSGTQRLQFVNGLILGQLQFSNPIPTRTNLLPTQTGLDGQVLTTNGTDVFWGDAGDFQMLFDYGDATPKNLFIVPADKIIESVSIILMTDFDDPATSLSIGDAGDPNRLLSTTDNTTQVIGTYLTRPGYKYAINTQLILTIVPGASTQGNGLVTITYQK